MMVETMQRVGEQSRVGVGRGNMRERVLDQSMRETCRSQRGKIEERMSIPQIIVSPPNQINRNHTKLSSTMKFSHFKSPSAYCDSGLTPSTK